MKLSLIRIVVVLNGLQHTFYATDIVEHEELTNGVLIKTRYNVNKYVNVAYMIERRAQA